ncbi:MAG: SOS response-associated peptidase family protein [Clostridia bacterium]|nr:SOS response-associated peptidase family protein [Clostridia bacterium]
MCCRYYFSHRPEEDEASTILSLMERDYPGAYKLGEIFPGDTAAAVIGEEKRLRHVPAVFGFPGFKPNALILNARAETAADKPTFAESLRYRRVILPANGFFEWGRDENKTKYLFTLDGLRTLYLGGLYKLVEGKYRFVILTRPANDSMREVHDRMPVIVGARDVRPYLTDPAAAIELISAPAPMLHRTPADP